jgi:predicted RNase H-like nuclease (RuvC/YqgF family)
MELGVRELLTIATVVSGIAATWGLVKSQLGRALNDLTSLAREIQTLETKTEDYVAKQEVLESKLDVISNILSPDNQERRAREIELVQNKIKHMKEVYGLLYEEVEKIKLMHNGKHPKIV